MQLVATLLLAAEVATEQLQYVMKSRLVAHITVLAGAAKVATAALVLVLALAQTAAKAAKVATAALEKILKAFIQKMALVKMAKMAKTVQRLKNQDKSFLLAA